LTTASFADKMDDADLLNPRTSVLSDAVHLLESAIPRFKAEMLRNVAPNNARYSAPYTFPIPEYGHHRLSHTSNVVTGHSGRHDLLPYRDDSSSSSIRGVSPPNNEVELPRFHTNIGRFANGVANRVALSQRHPLPMNEMRTDNADNIASSQQNSVAAQNPSHLTYSGCSNGVDPAKYQKLQTKIFPKSSAQLLSRNWSDKISNHQGHNLLDMNHLGSLTIGYFDKEQPYHRTPEANSGTTAVMMDPESCHSYDRAFSAARKNNTSGNETQAQFPQVAQCAKGGAQVVAQWLQRALDMGVDALRAEYRGLAKYTLPEMTVDACKANQEAGKNR
uniref:Pecanex-like protein n=1 Tax=Angiostrongylus cantonensis TaxID=6313 RepID=A0A0K0DL60_ANGCA